MMYSIPWTQANTIRMDTLSDHYKPLQAKEMAEMPILGIRNRLAMMNMVDLDDYRRAKIKAYSEEGKMGGVVGSNMLSGVIPNTILPDGSPANVIVAGAPNVSPAAGVPDITSPRMIASDQNRAERAGEFTRRGNASGYGGDPLEFAPSNTADTSPASSPVSPAINSGQGAGGQTSSPPLSPQAAQAALLSQPIPPSQLPIVAPNVSKLIDAKLISPIGPNGRLLNWGEIQLKEEQIEKALKHVTVIGTMMHQLGLKRFKVLQPQLAKAFPSLGIDKLNLSDVEETNNGTVTPIKRPDGSDSGLDMVTWMNQETGKMEAKVSKRGAEPGEKAIMDDHKWDGIQLKKAKGEPLTVEEISFDKSYQDRKVMAGTGAAMARTDAPYISSNVQDMVKIIKEGLLNGTRGPNQIRQTFGTGPIAEMAITQAMREDPTYDPVKAHASEKALDKIVDRRALIDVYRTRIEENARILKGYQAKYPQEYGTLINGAVNLFIRGVTGSGDQESLRMVIQSISQEVSRVESMQLGVGAVAEGARKVWDAFHNPHMNEKDMNKVIDTSLDLGGAAMTAINRVERGLRRDMGGRAARDRFGESGKEEKFDMEVKISTTVEEIKKRIGGDETKAKEIKRKGIRTIYRAAGTTSDISDEEIDEDYNKVYGDKYGKI